MAETRKCKVCQRTIILVAGQWFAASAPSPYKCYDGKAHKPKEK